MGAQKLQFLPSAAWVLAAEQDDVISRRQLLELGLSGHAIRHRVARGRLHPVWRGVYAVGRPTLSRRGWWRGALLACGQDAVLSHDSAAAVWGIAPERRAAIQVSVPMDVMRRRHGIQLHRRAPLDASHLTTCHGIPVTSPALTLLDMATLFGRDSMEAAINEADKHDLIDPEALRAALDELPRRPGVRALRNILDRRTFQLSDSALERMMLPIIRDVGLPPPQMRRYANGFRVDFLWPELGLVLETDGLRYHRTPAQQARDRRRDQAHMAAGLVPLRFTYEQVRYEAHHVRSTLAAVATRLMAERNG